MEVARHPNSALHLKHLNGGKQMVSFNLEGKIALVTGASRGIGRSIAEIFAEYGAEIILVSRKINSLKEVADGIVEKGKKAMPLACNMGDVGAIQSVCEQI